MFLDILKCILWGLRFVIIIVSLFLMFFGVYVDLIFVNIWCVLLFKFKVSFNNLFVFLICFVLVIFVICKLILVKLLNLILGLIGFLVSGLFGLILFFLVIRFFFDFLIILFILFILICCINGLNLLIVWLISVVCVFCYVKLLFKKVLMFVVIFGRIGFK